MTASLSPSDFVGAGGFIAANYILPTIATGAGQIVPASLAGYPTPPDRAWPVLSFGNNLSKSLSAEFSLDDDLGPFSGPAFEPLESGPAPRPGTMIYPPNTAISPAIHFAPDPN